jgi:hypothetical protein
MAQAQKIQSLATLERFSSYVSNLALNTQRPDVLDKWDMDQTVDVYADSAGIDPHLVRSDDDVAAMRQARAQAQQQQAAAERMAQMAPGGTATLADRHHGEERAHGSPQCGRRW